MPIVSDKQKSASILSKLPKQQFQGTNTDVKKLVSSLQSDPKLFADAVEALRADPRGVITSLFVLSPEQMARLAQMNDSELNKLLEPVLSLPDGTDWSKQQFSLHFSQAAPQGLTKERLPEKGEVSCTVKWDVA